MPSEVRLVVGLGNPGPEYVGTRHNVGFLTADRFVGECEASWGPSPVGDGLAARVRLDDGPDLWAAKPHTYMNESGTMVAPLARYFKIPPGAVLVVSDDMDLPLGRIRVRAKGSSGGQRGLDSILRHLGSTEVPRIRLGVGPRPERMEAADFVLGRFRPEEREAAERLIERGAEAVRTVLRDGVAAAMNAFNGGES